MVRPPPKSTRTDTLFPLTTLVRSAAQAPAACGDQLWRLCGGTGRNRGMAAENTTTGPRTKSRAGIHQPGPRPNRAAGVVRVSRRSEEHTSELQSLMRISYALFCLKKKK